MAQQKNHKEEKYELISFFFFVGFIVIIALIYFSIRGSAYRQSNIPLIFSALVMGLFFEYRRISQKWSELFLITFGAFAAGLLYMLIFRMERHRPLDTELNVMALAFCFAFIILAVIFREKETIIRLTEGITLLQSVALIYYLLDFDFLESEFLSVKIISVIAMVISIFVITGIFAGLELSKRNRFLLSLWSSIIMLVLAADNLAHVYKNSSVESTSDFLEACYIGVQYFLLGVASIYIAQNFRILFELWEERRTSDFQKIKDLHISRYRREKINKLHGVICILVSTTIFGINYYFELVPRSFAIWGVFIMIPVLLDWIFVNKKKAELSPSKTEAIMEMRSPDQHT